MTTSRRMFLQILSATGAFVSVAACRVSEGESGTLADPVTPTTPGTDDPEIIMVSLQDILTEGWSTLGSGFLGFNGPLKAQLIKDNKTVTLPYVQDPHGHTFTLTPAHFAELRKGKIVDVTTTLALGHRHIVRINPARIVAGSPILKMPVEIANGDLPAAQTTQPTQPAQPSGPVHPTIPSSQNATVEPG